MVVTMRSTRKGHAYLFYASADGKVSCLFPNQFHVDDAIEADRDVKVPGPESKYMISIGKPFGTEVLKLIVTARPLNQVAIQNLVNAIAAPVEIQALQWRLCHGIETSTEGVGRALRVDQDGAGWNAGCHSPQRWCGRIYRNGSIRRVGASPV
jgi:hypothetical protein